MESNFWETFAFPIARDVLSVLQSYARGSVCTVMKDYVERQIDEGNEEKAVTVLQMLLTFKYMSGMCVLCSTMPAYLALKQLQSTI